MKLSAIYIVHENGDIYVGSTGNLERRLKEHERKGRSPVDAMETDCSTPERFKLERKMSRFFDAQSQEEEFKMINTDY